MEFMSKIRTDRGEARLVIILVMVAVVLAGIAVYPLAKDMSENGFQSSEDRQYEETVFYKAKNELTGSGLNVAVYDGSTKQLVAVSEAPKIKPYGSNTEHKGKMILAKLNEDGKVTITWLTPEEIAAGIY